MLCCTLTDPGSGYLNVCSLTLAADALRTPGLRTVVGTALRCLPVTDGCGQRGHFQEVVPFRGHQPITERGGDMALPSNRPTAILLLSRSNSIALRRGDEATWGLRGTSYSLVWPHWKLWRRKGPQGRFGSFQNITLAASVKKCFEVFIVVAELGFNSPMWGRNVFLFVTLTQQSMKNDTAKSTNPSKWRTVTGSFRRDETEGGGGRLCLHKHFSLQWLHGTFLGTWLINWHREWNITTPQPLLLPEELQLD